LNRDRVRVKSLRDFVRAFGENKPKLATVEGEEPPLVPTEELDVVVDEGEIRQTPVSWALQPPLLLDTFQDEVLRRPFNSRQFIVGPPGTGKTTTLIRRLDFMIAGEALEAENSGLAEKLARQSAQPHQVSWYFFVPSDSVRQYLRDSFNKLIIPAFDKNTLTWEEARIDLATNHFRVLASNGCQGLRLAKPNGKVSKAAIGDTIGWYSDFSAYQAKAYFKSLKTQALFLSERPDGEIAHLGQQLQELLEKSADHSLLWFKRALDPFQEAIGNLVSAKGEILAGELKSAFQGHTERDPSLIEGLVALSASGERGKKPDESDGEPNIFRREAFRVYSSALLDHSVALAKGKKLPRDSRSGRVLGWLGEGRLLPQARLQELGNDQVVCRALKRFKTDSKAFYNSYFDSIVGNYLRFRSHNRLWYSKAFGSSRQVEPLEVDLLLLAFLEPGAEILKNFDLPRDKACLNWSLDNQAYLTRNQVLVDVANDFSPVQLKCAASLANPALGSVTVAADLCSRTADHGLKSLDDLEWALPKAILTELQINYRQSSQLVELTDLLSGASQSRFLANRFELKGPKPALAQNCGSLAQTANWLSDRVSEIVSRTGRLPSTAIAVLKPFDVGPLAESLTKALEGQDFKALAYRPGQPMGLSADIRILTLEESRGLGFEAFFLVSQGEPYPADLLGRLIYLAATRAVTYLGFAFRDAMPTNLDNLARLTVPSWSQPQEAFVAVSL
jgi:hypothetical protein